jgi:iron complex outermembrane receptor protein
MNRSRIALAVLLAGTTAAAAAAPPHTTLPAGAQPATTSARGGAAGLGAVGSGAVTATAAPAAAATGAAASHPGEDPRIEEIHILGHPLAVRADELAQPVHVLRGDELARSLGQTIGETVARVPGIQSATFGRGVGRPVIRGLEGARVRVLQDNLDTLDASAVSGDHAVTVEPFVAEQVEVLKGPATLLFGSGASGGIVDVHTGRLAFEPDPGPLRGRFEARADDAASERTAAGRLGGGSGGFTWHLDGLRRETSDYDIPGFAESKRLRALEAAEEEEEEGEGEDHHEAEARGRLPDSWTDARGGAAAAGYATDTAFASVAVSRFETQYGIPGHSHEEGEEEAGEEGAGVHVDLRQTRYDIAAGTRRDDGTPGVEMRLAINRYAHDEIEGDGALGTAFRNDGHDLRVLFHHGAIAGWDGAVGQHWTRTEFAARGEEAFVPPSERTSVALFAVEERRGASVDWQAGVRYERTRVETEDGRKAGISTLSASLGALRDLGAAWTLAVQIDRSARAPVTEELYADGPHLATGSFERGDAGLDTETSLNASATLRGGGDTFDVTLGVFASRFGDFIYLEDTGLVEDGLPLRQHRQADATFTGAEAELAVRVLDAGERHVELRLFGDVVDARLTDRPASGYRDVPRLAPARVGAGVTVAFGRASADLRYTYVASQRDVAGAELPTDAYGLLDLHAGWHVDVGGTHVELFARGSNLTDREARNHLSPIKDLAPLPGRTLTGGVRVAF